MLGGFHSIMRSHQLPLGLNLGCDTKLFSNQIILFIKKYGKPYFTAIMDVRELLFFYLFRDFVKRTLLLIRLNWNFVI